MQRVVHKRPTRMNEDGLKRRSRRANTIVDFDDDGFADDFDIDLQEVDSSGGSDDANLSPKGASGSTETA